MQQGLYKTVGISSPACLYSVVERKDLALYLEVRLRESALILATSFCGWVLDEKTG